MIITFDLTWLMTFVPFIMVGFGIGYLTILVFKGSSNTKLDNMKDDLEAKKEWIRMVSEQKKELAKKDKWNNNVRRYQKR
jgi:hypothetical protein